MITALNILIFIFLAYLIVNVSYLLIFSIAGRLPSQAPIKINSGASLAKIAVFIPAYKEDAVIIDTAKKALVQDYPSDAYDIIIIADSLHPKTIESLRQYRVKVTEVTFRKSTKAKALNKAMDELKEIYDVAVVLDADNIMNPAFLSSVNKAYQNSHQVMQGHRIAKNTDTSFAVLDAVSEEINNHIFRRGHQKLRLSAALIGSGMAFDYQLFKRTMADIDAISGFDKELEINLIEKGYRISYLEDATVFDEKVAHAEVFDKQRTRWIAAQVYYARKATFPALKALITRGNFDLFNKVLQFWLLPRVMLLGLLTLLIPLAFFFPDGWVFPLLWGLTVLALAMAIPGSLTGKPLLKALLHLPKAFFLMIKASFSIKKARKKFLHTPHHTISRD